MGGWTVLRVQEPLIGPERTMEPQRVIEAGELNVPVEPEFAVGDQGRVEQREVGGVSQHALVQRQGIGKRAVGAHPNMLYWRPFLALEVARDVHGAQLDRPL